MTTVAASGPVPKLSFGPVVQGAFGVLKRSFPTFLALVVMLQSIPAVLMILGAVQPETHVSMGGVLLMLLGGLLLLVGSAMLAPALIHGAVADLNGRKAAFADCLRSGVRHALPVFAIMMLTVIGVMFGLLLLIVPGIMLALAWSVALPARVVERTGVFAAFSRSGALTKGSRWRLFWLFVLYSIVSGAVQQAMLGLALMVPGAQMAMGAADPDALTPAIVVVAVATSLLNTLVTYTGVAVIYYELRRLKEGIGPEALAAVFD